MLTRTTHLVLIAVLAAPTWSVQADCGCGVDPDSSGNECSCDASTTCCSKDVSPSSCCGGNATSGKRGPANNCQCGDNCQCGQAEERSPDQPATPPSSTASDDLLRLLTATSGCFDVPAPSLAIFSPDQRTLGIHPRSAQQACVELNRFLL